MFQHCALSSYALTCALLSAVAQRMRSASGTSGLSDRKAIECNIPVCIECLSNSDSSNV